MQIASYLGQSRHGVYYFRWPLPRHLHPYGRASQIRVSLRTRARLHKTNKDSCRESNVVADGHEQTAIAYLQDHELDCLQ
jgi:hypothetical protein